MFRFASLLALSVVSTFAATISFEGVFKQDDDVQAFLFNLSSPATVTIRTYSYAGGTNAANRVIPRGGFDPIISLFDSSGLLIGFNNDGSCLEVSQDSVTNACWDSFFAPTLSAGTYVLFLTQADNAPIGPMRVDDFQRAGQVNFTGPAFLGAPGSFIDQTGNQRTNAWALDIFNVDSATTDFENQIPEPGSALLLSAALAVFAVRKLRK